MKNYPGAKGITTEIAHKAVEAAGDMSNYNYEPVVYLADPNKEFCLICNGAENIKRIELGISCVVVDITSRANRSAHVTLCPDHYMDFRDVVMSFVYNKVGETE